MWCPELESNQHGYYPTRSLVLRVCQFRHPGTGCSSCAARAQRARAGSLAGACARTTSLLGSAPTSPGATSARSPRLRPPVERPERHLSECHGEPPRKRADRTVRRSHRRHQPEPRGRDRGALRGADRSIDRCLRRPERHPAGSSTSASIDLGRESRERRSRRVALTPCSRPRLRAPEADAGGL